MIGSPNGSCRAGMREKDRERERKGEKESEGLKDKKVDWINYQHNKDWSQDRILNICDQQCKRIVRNRNEREKGERERNGNI
jgi:hypothetical protein